MAPDPFFSVSFSDRRPFISILFINMGAPTNSNESYCTFTLASDVTAGGLPSEDEIAKDLESSDNNVSCWQKEAFRETKIQVLARIQYWNYVQSYVFFGSHSSNDSY